MEENPLEIRDSEVLLQQVEDIMSSVSSTSQDTKQHKCDTCGYTTHKLSILKRHKFVHTGIKLYKCGVCDYGSNRVDRLKTHELKHNGEKLYKCDVCSYTCYHPQYLKKHKLTHVQSEKRLYKCYVCDYGSNRLDHLKAHELIHKGEKPFKCELCSYACRFSGNLKAHKRVHIGEKPFKCGDCDSTYSHPCSLKKHISKVHNREGKSIPALVRLMSWKDYAGSFKDNLILALQTLHICIDCKYYTESVFELRKHLLQHSDLR